MISLLNKKPRRIIDSLREKFPDEDWKAIKKGSYWSYVNNKGEYGRWAAASAPRYDGDDETFISEFWIYRKNASPERMWFF